MNKLLIALALFAVVAVSMAQLLYPGQPVLTGLGEIAIDGHSKIQYQGFNNPSHNGYGFARIPAYGLNYWRR